VPGNHNLEIHYAPPGNGNLLQEEFDMVVLSCGLQPSAGASDLAETLGIQLTPDGFCQIENLSPLSTNREGIFVCGSFTDPKDIPETVMSASGAAANAMTLLSEARGTMITPKEYPPEKAVSDQEARLGVFVCHCGTNIAGVIDVAAVADYACSLSNVVHSECNLFTCSTDSQRKIRQAIEEHELNRVVVASCTPRTHERLFQDCIREAGLNEFLFELANIRDQCSWVHRDFPNEATEKAKDLVRIAVAKARLLEPLERKSIELNHDALVIGGGLAGMTAALDLADQGFLVSLVERDSQLGGNMHHLHYLLTHNNPQFLLKILIEQVKNHSNINVFLNAEVESFEGSLGNFKSSLKPAGIPSHIPQNNGNGQADTSNNSKEIDAEDTVPTEYPLINHGIVILATGAEAYQPSEYHYGEDKRILTQMEFEDELANKYSELRSLKSIVMIQCVGSRTPERPYCSRLCCNQAIKNAIVLKDLSPETEVYILYRDIRTYGLLEKYYRQARGKGVVFARYEDDAPPQISLNGKLKVSMVDALLGAQIELEADRLVLSVATIPRSDSAEIAKLLKVPRTQDGFFQEAHMKLAPVDFANEGIFLCGLAHYPKKALTESAIQAKAAAARAATVLAKQAIAIDPMISHVVEDKCDGCAYCVDPCPFKAITLIEFQNEQGQTKKRVVVDETMCKGCGTCQATCPKNAIFVSHFKLDYLRAMTMAALEF
jgi:heterodisulfide reductase subunit A